MQDKSIIHIPLQDLDYSLLYKGDTMGFSKGKPIPYDVEIYPYVFVTKYKHKTFRAKIMSVKKKWNGVFVNTRELK